MQIFPQNLFTGFSARAQNLLQESAEKFGIVAEIVILIQ